MPKQVAVILDWNWETRKSSEEPGNTLLMAYAEVWIPVFEMVGVLQGKKLVDINKAGLDLEKSSSTTKMQQGAGLTDLIDSFV